MVAAAVSKLYYIASPAKGFAIGRVDEVLVMTKEIPQRVSREAVKRGTG